MRPEIFPVASIMAITLNLDKKLFTARVFVAA